MFVCKYIVTPIVYIINILIEVFKLVEELVCNVIKVLKEVNEWVASKLCNRKRWNPFCWIAWVLRAVLRWVDEIVCKTVMKWVSSFIQAILTYTISLLKIVCAWVDFGITAWLCLFENRREKCMGICVVSSLDANGNPIISSSDMQALVSTASQIYKQCNVSFKYCKHTRLEYGSPLSDVNVERLSDLFWRPLLMNFYRNESCSCCDLITLFVTDNIAGAAGWAVPGENWAIIQVSPSTYGTSSSTFNSDAQTIAHEIGHLCLLGHTTNNSNLMFGGSSTITNAPTAINNQQCCRIRRSRFARRECRCQ
jgi:hypothetical protein